MKNAFLSIVLASLLIVSIAASTFQISAYGAAVKYTIRIDGADNIAVNNLDETVFRVPQNDSSRDIIQLVHDRIQTEAGNIGGIISVDPGIYPVHKQMIFTVPIILVMQKTTVLLFDNQSRGDVAILNTKAKSAINSGVFDCNKAVQTKYWIHGLKIGVGSEGSTVKGIEARNCSTYGNGIVLRANYSTVINSYSHHNGGDGIYLRSCDHCTVQKSWFSYNGVNGIDASDQDGKLAGHTLIYNNTANWNHDGINLDSTYFANVTQNSLYGNWIGIAEYHSTSDNLNNSITDNTIKYSPQWGIYEQEYIPWHDPYISDYSTITGNMMISNGHENVIKTESTHTMVENNTFVD